MDKNPKIIKIKQKKGWENQCAAFFNFNVLHPTITPFGDWRIKNKGFEYLYRQRKMIYLCNNDILHLLTDERLNTLSLDDIAWKGKNFSDDDKYKSLITSGRKWENCDTKFPIIAIEENFNPMNLKYTLIDGRHRAEKLLSQNCKNAKVYVLKWNDIKNYLKIRVGLDSNNSKILVKVKYNKKGRPLISGETE
tara:strand:+ start:42 stop:620 length:579 start_codon:yes stop_codon:yes gene_type:complete